MEMYGLNKDDILTQVKNEKNLSRDYFENKRDIFRERIKLINGQNKNKDKVNINIAAAQINTLIALSYQDELSVAFSGRSFEDFEVADNLNNLAKFDVDEMEMDWKNYQKEFDRLFYGVSIRVFTGYDIDRSVPEYCVEDPLCWYADPQPRGFTAQDFRFHGFEKEISEQELRNRGSALASASEHLYNIDELKLDESNDRVTNLQYRNEASGLNYQKDKNGNKLVTIYNHYTNINGDKYFIVCDSECKVLMKIFKLEAVGEIEKKNSELVPFPIVLNYFRPERDNPFGISLMDFVEDKQRASSKLFNLQLIKATKEALGGDFVYDINKIKNRNDLQQPSVKSRYIGVNLKTGENIGNVVSEVPREKLSVDIENMRMSINREIQNSTGVDNIIQGVRGDKSITARESQTIQQNANLNLALNNKVNSWGEKSFWYLWYRCYKEFFGSSEEKIVRLSNGVGSSVISFKRSDFITTQDIDIDIINKSDEQVRLEQEKLNIPYYQILLQDPNIEEINKIYIKRHILKISGTSPDMIMQMVPETYEELDAKNQLNMLNKNIDVEYYDVNLNQYTYLSIYKRGLLTEAMRKAIRKREMIYLEQLKQKRLGGNMMGMEGGNIGAMQNQLMANSLQQQRVVGESASLQDIAG